MRSTSEPRIRQQVMAAKVAWKATYTSSYSGVPLAERRDERERAESPGRRCRARNSRLRPPMNALPCVKASE